MELCTFVTQRKLCYLTLHCIYTEFRETVIVEWSECKNKQELLDIFFG